MSRKTGDKKDRTSLIISLVFHVLLIGAVGYWAWKAGLGDIAKRKYLEFVRGEKKQEQRPQQPQARQATPPPQLPKINEGMPPPPSSGTRRAVAADAPEAAGDSFFQDLRKQVQGPGGASGGPAQKVETPKIVVAPPKPVVPAMRAAGPSTIKQLHTERAKQAAATEAFGSEQISKSGVSDAGAIVNKVSGAAIVDGKFAVIRGLSDRYVTTTLNGAEIPSADPYRRSASLDLFPAQIINKVVVAKTFTPEQPGAYTGGGINIVTKSFPERPFISISMGISYNTQTTGNEDFLTYDGGKNDWLGTDDGGRSLPPGLKSPTLILPPKVPNSGLPSNPDREKNIRDAERLQAATREMGTAQFAPTREAPPVNHNFGFAVGDTTHLFGKPLGVFASMSYKRDYSFYEDGRQVRDQPGVGGFTNKSDFADARSLDVVNWSGMVNLAYQLHPDHELGFSFLYNQNAEDLVRQQSGTRIEDPLSLYFANRLQFTERNLQTYQLKGAHVMPEFGGVRFDWLGAYSTTTQDEPDVRFFNFLKDEGGNFVIGKSGTPEPKQPTRYFRALDEENTNFKGDLTIPFRQWAWNPGELKFGYFDSRSDRTFFDRGVEYGTDHDFFDGDPNNWLTATNLGFTSITNRRGNIIYTWDRYIQLRDSEYSGDSTILAGYGMLDMPLHERLRLVGGARYEATEMNVFSRSYLPIAATGLTTNTTELSQKDVLPAVGLIYSLRPDMNVRLSYSQTIARPSFRELAGYRSYDPILDELLEGNPALQIASSENYDLRWEWFFRPGELLSVSFFYKALKNPIERYYVTIDQDIVSFTNRESATVMGVEFEARKTLGFVDPLLSYFSLGGNFSLIHSDTEHTKLELINKAPYDPDLGRSRALYDQSPYILNVDLSYDNPFTGTAASLIFNVQGPRITIAGYTTLDVYEQPATSLDFLLGQRLGRHLTVKFGIRNILDPKVERTYGENGPRLNSTYRRGRTFALSMNYDF